MAIFEPYWRPSALSGLEVGANILWDEIPDNMNASPPRDEDLREVIAGGYLIYEGVRFQLFVEEQYILHEHGAEKYESWGGTCRPPIAWVTSSLITDSIYKKLTPKIPTTRTIRRLATSRNIRLACDSHRNASRASFLRDWCLEFRSLMAVEMHG